MLMAFPLRGVYIVICCDKATRSILFSMRVEDLRQNEPQQLLAMKQSWAEFKFMQMSIWHQHQCREWCSCDPLLDTKTGSMTNQNDYNKAK